MKLANATNPGFFSGRLFVQHVPPSTALRGRVTTVSSVSIPSLLPAWERSKARGQPLPPRTLLSALTLLEAQLACVSG